MFGTLQEHDNQPVRRNLAKRFSSSVLHQKNIDRPRQSSSRSSKTLHRERKTKSIQQLFTYSSQFFKFMGGNVEEQLDQDGDDDEPQSPGEMSFWCRGEVSSSLSLADDFHRQSTSSSISRSIASSDYHLDGSNTLCEITENRINHRLYHVYDATTHEGGNESGVDWNLITGREWDDVTFIRPGDYESEKKGWIGKDKEDLRISSSASPISTVFEQQEEKIISSASFRGSSSFDSSVHCHTSPGHRNRSSIVVGKAFGKVLKRFVH